MVKPATALRRPRSRDAAGLPAVTPEKIIASALALTARHGLDGWTLRQLAGEVDAYPAVVYHHVGDREAVVAGVVDRVIGLLPVPEPDLPWREWYRAVLADLRTLLTGYPGVARRLALFGPTSAAAALTDHGMRTLQAGGFGEEAHTVHQLLLTTACLFVSTEDERHRNAELKERNVELMTQYRDDNDRPGLAAFGSALFDLLNDPRRRASYFADLYDYAVQRCLDGVACRLSGLQERRSRANPGPGSVPGSTGWSC
jgi:AcrR family transcriptional regulator